jgi:hypothetical protein
MSAPDIDLTGQNPAPAPTIIYLDQNKWIDLARAVKDPDRYSAQGWVELAKPIASLQE